MDFGELRPDFILKNFRILNDEHIVEALTTPHLVQTLLAVAPKFSDEQLRMAVPLMSTEMIKTLIPRLQLQQTGVAVQVMGPAQVRATLQALTGEDRYLLSENIALLTSSSNKDELQNFMAFVDPLAMCIAIQIPLLAPRLIDASAVMTVDQIRIAVPLMTIHQIKDLFCVIEDENQVTTASQMIEKKDELRKLLLDFFPDQEKQRAEIPKKSTQLSEQLNELKIRIDNLSKNNDKTLEHENLVKLVKSLKSEIELWQQKCRQLVSSTKLPIQLFVGHEHISVLEKFQKLAKEVADLGKEFHSKFLLLDSYTNLLNQQWSSIKPQKETKVEPKEQSNDVFEDSDLALILYQAVKEIGNPDSIGNYYTFSWDDIIKAGFRSSKDFKEKQITNMEQLQQFINNYKKNNQ